MLFQGHPNRLGISQAEFLRAQKTTIQNQASKGQAPKDDISETYVPMLQECLRVLK